MTDLGEVFAIHVTDKEKFTAVKIALDEVEQIRKTNKRLGAAVDKKESTNGSEIDTQLVKVRLKQFKNFETIMLAKGKFSTQCSESIFDAKI